MRLIAGQGKYPYSQGLHLVFPTVLYAFGDESGLHSSPKYCLVAGYIGPPDQWAALRPAWNAVLEKDDYGVVDGFHAVRFFGGQKQYRAWGRVKRDAFLDELLTVITEHGVYPFGAAVDVEAFMALSEPQRRYFTGARIELRLLFRKSDLAIGGFVGEVNQRVRGASAPKQAYRAAVVLFLGDAIHLAPENCEVHAVLGSHNALAAGVVEFFNNRIKDASYPGGRTFQSVVYASAARTPELQVADLYAYLLARQLNGAPMDDRSQRAVATLSEKPPGIRIADAAFFAGEWAAIEKSVNDEITLHGFPPSEHLSL